MGMIRPINEEEKDTTIAGHFSDLNDPRIDRTKRHKLADIITIAICSTLCMGESWDAMEEFGQTHEQWLRKFLELPNGIPSHDTFNRHRCSGFFYPPSNNNLCMRANDVSL
jgi:hypothetical protein